MGSNAAQLRQRDDLFMQLRIFRETLQVVRNLPQAIRATLPLGVRAAEYPSQFPRLRYGIPRSSAVGQEMPALLEPTDNPQTTAPLRRTPEKCTLCLPRKCRRRDNAHQFRLAVRALLADSTAYEWVHKTSRIVFAGARRRRSVVRSAQTWGDTSPVVWSCPRDRTQSSPSRCSVARLQGNASPAAVLRRQAQNPPSTPPGSGDGGASNARYACKWRQMRKKARATGMQQTLNTIALCSRSREQHTGNS